jgi:hypothetical protein
MGAAGSAQDSAAGSGGSGGGICRLECEEGDEAGVRLVGERCCGAGGSDGGTSVLSGAVTEASDGMGGGGSGGGGAPPHRDTEDAGRVRLRAGVDSVCGSAGGGGKGGATMCADGGERGNRLIIVAARRAMCGDMCGTDGMGGTGGGMARDAVEAALRLERADSGEMLEAPLAGRRPPVAAGTSTCAGGGGRGGGSEERSM